MFYIVPIILVDCIAYFCETPKQGIATPKQDIELIEARLKRAKEHYKKQLQGNKYESGR